jgi:hypothetical protein
MPPYWCTAADAGLELLVLHGDYDESPYVPGIGPFVIAIFARR